MSEIPMTYRRADQNPCHRDVRTKMLRRSSLTIRRSRPSIPGSCSEKRLPSLLRISANRYVAESVGELHLDFPSFRDHVALYQYFRQMSRGPPTSAVMGRSSSVHSHEPLRLKDLPFEHCPAQSSFDSDVVACLDHK